MLINSFEERRTRSQVKRSAILHFLRDETWSNFANLTSITKLSEPATFKTLQQMERDQMIFRHKVPELRLSLWGITSQGLAFSWDEAEAMEVRQYFEPSKVSIMTIHHYLDVQRARLAAERAGWSNWIPGHCLPMNIKKRPDAVATDPQGRTIAIEVERSIKTLKRYEVIMAIYLQSIKRGDYAMVHYVCPHPEFAPRLSRIFGLIKSVPVAGERVPITDRHLARFPVFALENWPYNAK
ncbi:MobC family replication-relaxation protein [Glaciimonas sp. CA11.2]|uniref:MobC family replication-relaxation protein n=1 Tax=Glaciimonas sp. CA11.2 TaxID=3048601 RepID=UPI002AB53786|nr:MobC family replication-relaxation protein [Glaciimonas sp. CA11.2]MDY7544624.1 MobC family replication-relaxation protein [Glaciimonas sp. CA11.2]MEB0165026.1 MobC family replication-relaxation protein [Glaciimonas sp. CA11.2]